MTKTKRVKSRVSAGLSRRRSGSRSPKSKAGAKGKNARKGNGLTLMAVAEESKPRSRREALEQLLRDMKGFYRPVKSPVTMRLDADVLAWFKKDGSRYQTRINQALRKVMEQEMKEGGGIG